MQFVFNTQDLIDAVALQVTIHHHNNHPHRTHYVEDTTCEIGHTDLVSGYAEFWGIGHIHGQRYDYSQHELTGAIGLYINEKFNIEAEFKVDFNHENGQYTATVTLI